jgi:hypothetical protein
MSLPKPSLFLLALTACDGKGDDSNGTNLPPGCDTDICTGEYAAIMPSAIKEIVQQVTTDPDWEDEFAPLVKGGKEAIGAFEQSLANFLGQTYGCPDVPPYDGPSMEEAHAGMNLTEQDYDDFVAIVAGVLANNGVLQETINTCFAPPLQEASLRDSIIGQ